jgi:hypothetical protein
MTWAREHTKLTISKIYGKIFHWCLFKYIYENIKHIYTSYIFMYYQCCLHKISNSNSINLNNTVFILVQFTCTYTPGYANNLFCLPHFVAIAFWAPLNPHTIHSVNMNMHVKISEEKWFSRVENFRRGLNFVGKV